MNSLKVFLSAPDVGRAEEKAVLRALRSGWVAPLGPEVDSFEQEMSNYLGVTHAVALSSGTAALHLGLKSLGVQPGDSVITSTMTFVATANAITYTGAIPVFVDTNRDGTIDLGCLERALQIELDSGRRVGAVIPVDIYGRAANYSALEPLLEQYAIPMLADAAESLGAKHNGAHAGSFGDCAILSFNGNKIMTTSGGGMFLSSSEQLANHVRYLASQARQPVPHYEHTEVGYNYRMSNVLAAIGRAQLARLPEMIRLRRDTRREYEDLFSDYSGVTFLDGSASEDNCWLSVILVDSSIAGWSSVDLMEYLAQNGIESRRLWKPMHLQPLYAGARYIGGEVAETLFDTGLALPSGSAMSERDKALVHKAITSFLASGHQ